MLLYMSLQLYGEQNSKHARQSTLADFDCTHVYRCTSIKRGQLFD